MATSACIPTKLVLNVKHLELADNELERDARRDGLLEILLNAIALHQKIDRFVAVLWHFSDQIAKSGRTLEDKTCVELMYNACSWRLSGVLGAAPGGAGSASSLLIAS